MGLPRGSDKEARGVARRIFDGHWLQTRDYRKACRAAGVSERTGRRWRRELLEGMPSQTAAIPQSHSSFEGRVVELEALEAFFREGVRLVTLVGAPGIGKTRLAIRWVERSRSSQRWASTTFCDLRSIESQDALIAEIAGRLGVPLAEDSERAIEGLGRVFAARGKALLLCDNFEQLTDAAAGLLGRWLQAAPELRMLVTSRRMLRLSGEEVFEVGPLTLPDAGAILPDLWATSSAMQLFWSRAKAVEPGLAQEALPLAEVADLVRHLEGHPLAIELAAAQLRRTGVRALLSEVKNATIGLSSPLRDADPDHATLAAAIERSWRLLTLHEKSALAQLSVFRNGFTTEAARAVVRWEAERAPAVDVVLAALRESSMIRSSTDSAGRRRWDLYEAVREFGAQRLAEGSGGDAVAERHAQHFLERGEQWVAARTHRGGTEAREALASELANLRRAFEWRRQHQDPDAQSLLRAGLVLYESIIDRLPGVAAKVATQALAAVDVSTVDRRLYVRVLLAKVFATRETGVMSRVDEDISAAEALLTEDAGLFPDAFRAAASLRAETKYLRGKIALRRGQVREAREHLEHAIPMARLCRSELLESRIRTELAVALAEGFGDPAALRHHRRAIALARASDDAYLEVRARMLEALHRMFFGRAVRRDELEEVQRTAQVLRGPYQEAFASLSLSVFCYEERRWAEAEALGRHTRNLCVQMGLRYMEVPSFFLIAMPMERRSPEAFSEPLALYEEAMRTAASLGERRLEALAAAFAAGLTARGGDIPEAIRLLSHAGTRLDSTGDVTFRRIFDVQRARLLLSGASGALRSGDVKRARRWRRLAQHQLDAARRRGARDGKALLPLAECSWEGRHAVCLAERVLDDYALAERALWVSTDAGRFRLGAMASCHTDGPVSRALLRSLVEHRLDAPGQALPTMDLIDRCWPGERMLPEAGFRRVRSVVRRLRRAGLETVLLTGEQGGYFLDPAVEIAVES